jgi:hypothetical protein
MIRKLTQMSGSASVMLKFDDSASNLRPGSWRGYQKPSEALAIQSNFDQDHWESSVERPIPIINSSIWNIF